jgi:hypothetical protein
VTGYDACAGLLVEVAMQQDTLDVPCRDGLVIERTWTAVDVCGNITVIHQTIVMNDQTPPEILIPSASVINYILDTDPELIYLSQTDLMHLINLLDENSVLVTDECDQDIIPVLIIDVLYGDCAEVGYSEHRVYTWVATDVCGNSTSVSVSIDIMDDLPPEMLVIAADTLIVCAELPPVPDMLVDSLSGDALVYTQVIVQGLNPNEFLVTRTWTATDSCGNATVVFQRITWIPETELECEVLRPLSVDCNSHGVIIGSYVTGGYGPLRYDWEVVGEKCFIQGGQGTPEIFVYIGWEDVKIILTVTDRFGCVSMCMDILHCDPAQSTSLTHEDEATFELNVHSLEPVIDTRVGRLSTKDLTELNVWPNPASGSISMSFESIIDQQVRWTLTNSVGLVVMNEELNALQGFNSRIVHLDKLPSGSYMLHVKTAQDMYAKGIVIMRRE